MMGWTKAERKLFLAGVLLGAQLYGGIKMMQVVCAWCGKDMGEKDGQGQEGATHGICEECSKKEMVKFVEGLK